MRFEVARFLHTVPGAIRIPVGSERRECKGDHCDEMIYLVRDATEPSKLKPVSIATYYTAAGGSFVGFAPTETEDGAGVSHFANCPDAKEFHSTKRRR